MKLNVTTPQEAFDKVVRHLGQQVGRSISNDGGVSCLYFVLDDEKNIVNRCAVGALIDESSVDLTKDIVDWNSLGVDGLVEYLDGESQDFFWEHAELLASLQSAHDDLDLRDASGRFFDWEGLRDIAHKYGLSDKVVDEVLGRSTGNY